jgi:hypothetical protein
MAEPSKQIPTVQLRENLRKRNNCLLIVVAFCNIKEPLNKEIKKFKKEEYDESRDYD